MKKRFFYLTMTFLTVFSLLSCGGNTTIGNNDNPDEITCQTISAAGVEFEMVFVKGGTFTMGNNNTYQSDEKPTHSVSLSDFYIGKYEVTQAQWKAVMGSNPSDFKVDNLPVEKVTWNDCQKFIRELNQLTGKNFRLPTEAEWEYAARGGNSSKGYKYAGSNNKKDVAWYWEDGSEYGDGQTLPSLPVGTKIANELGLYDMSGNVFEWCQDWYGDYSSSSQTNPTGPTSGSYHVYRGGGWYSDWSGRVGVSEVSARFHDYGLTDSCDNLGFRLVLSK